MLVAGQNCAFGDNVSFGDNIKIGQNVIIEDNVKLGNNVIIEDNIIIRSGVTLGNDTIVSSNCIIGEHLMDWYENRGYTQNHYLTIGDHALIRSGTIIYSDSQIGTHFQTGHFVSIREKSVIGNHVSVGTLCNIQGYCKIGDFVRMHSNVQIGQKSVIEDYVWIFPNVVLTNDPQPPSNELVGSHICSFAVVATGAIILPGMRINGDSLVAAGAVVAQDVAEFSVVRGNPAKHVLDIRWLRNQKTGEKVYPWRYYFERGMPWEDVGYEAWYAKLGVESIKDK